MHLKKILYTLSGDDYNIISLSGKAVQDRFMAIGGFVAIIFALCFLSCYITFTKLFQNYFVGIPIGLFFSYMITNIYLLLLYTLSRNSFPSKPDKAAQLFSIAIRVVFICFIAVIVSKPIETILFSSTVQNEIAVYKQVQINKYKLSTNEYYNQETKNLKLIIDKQKKLYANSDSNQIENYSNLLQKKECQKKLLTASMINLVNGSNYFVHSIVTLNSKYGFCWFITIFMIFIFLFPAYLKNFLGANSFYYEQKRNIEIRLVQEEYTTFKERYNSLLQEQFHKNIQFSEPYSDAPFNTTRKIDPREFLKEDDLISDLYNA